MGTTTLESLVRENEQSLNLLQEKIGYTFNDLKLLQLSMIHSSFGFERLASGVHNETQEFLGDAVLDLAVGHILFRRFPAMREGHLTRIRSALVNESGLARVARSLDLGDHLLLGRGEDNSLGRQKPSILSCAFEAMIGAIFLDGGYEPASNYVEKIFIPLIEEHGDKLKSADSKSELQERLQKKYNQGPSYRLDKEDGPAHARIFTVSAIFRDQIIGFGTAGSKKEAEQQAAKTALRQLNKILTAKQ